MSRSTSEHRQMAAATLVTTLGRPQAEGGAPLNAPIVLGSTYRADGDTAYGRDGIDDLWHDLERALDR